MNEKIAIEILKQANIETTVGCCEKCPRKDKNKTCIGCLDDAKDILLNHINNLQSKIDNTIELLEDFKSKSKDVENEWAVEICELSIRKLKEDK